jgi:PadR family transcriptional regulator PadR
MIEARRTRAPAIQFLPDESSDTRRARTEPGTFSTLLRNTQYRATVWNTLVMQSMGNGASPIADWTSQLRRGVLELCILQILRREPGYGYQIVTTLNALGPLSAGENTVYPLLRRLRAEGLLDTFMRESPTGPPRQYYRLTADGRKQLATLSKEWDLMAEAVARCMSEESHHERDASRDRAISHAAK